MTISGLLNAQSSDKIIQELKNRNIKSHTDLLNELKKQNITEEQAKQYAALYGINYDDFVKQYLSEPINTTTSELIPPSIPSSPTSLINPDTTKTNLEAIKTEEIVPDETKKQEQQEIDSRYFGYKLFQNIPNAFDPTEVGPIDPGYLIGPGDVLRLYVWGDVEFQYELTVDKTGNIFIPTAGQVFVLGISYEDLHTKLTNYLSKFYAGLGNSPPTAFLDVSLTKLRLVRIFAVGEVEKPGSYNVNSYSSVLNALYSFGGPTITGSLRDIRIVRDNKVVSNVDLYEFLLKGIISSDVRIQNNDLIFIPPRIKTVTISGEVIREGIYELKNGEKLKDILNFSGGLKSTAYLGRVQIKRVLPFHEREKSKPEMVIIDLELDKILSGEIDDVELYDNDEVTVFPIVVRMESQVEIEGAVYRPGVYDIKTVPTLNDLIEAAGFLPEVYLSKADLYRTRPDKTIEYISLDLNKAKLGIDTFNIKLKPLDKIKIYSIYDIQQNLSVSISGYVKNEFTIQYADSLTLYDMILQAGGLQDTTFLGQAFTLRGDIIRLNKDGYSSRIIPFNLNNVLMKNNNIKIEPGDKIYIYKGNVIKELEQTVRIEGEVRNPGQYTLNTNMTPMDLILQAGGFTEKAIRDFVYINRIRPEGYKADKLSESFSVKLPDSFDFLRNDTTFYLQNYDIVVVRKSPDIERQRVVKLYGEVNYPGVYVLGNRNETILDLLKQAGGPTSESFLFGTHFSRGNKRVILNLESLYVEGDTDENIYLQENDSIYVPKRPNSVIVSGEVNSPGIFNYLEGLDVKDYIDRAGGLTDESDYAVYTQPTGISQRVNFGWFTSDPEVYDGSVIFVKKMPPPDPNDHFDFAALIKDIFAISASVITIIVLVSRLN